jgi:hypothetical protein
MLVSEICISQRYQNSSCQNNNACAGRVLIRNSIADFLVMGKMLLDTATEISDACKPGLSHGMAAPSFR